MTASKNTRVNRRFRLAPVTWAMHGPSPFISKVIQMFFSMDSMFGEDFETGLANLKASAEK